MPARKSKLEIKERPYTLIQVERKIADKIKAEAKRQGKFQWKYTSELLAGKI